MSESKRTGQEQLDDFLEANPHLERTEPSIAWVLKVVIMAMLVAVAIPTGSFLYLNARSSDERIEQNLELIEEFERQRIEVQERVNGFIYEQCIQAEVRDTVYALWGSDLLLILKSLPPENQNDQRVRKAITDFEDGIALLEPEDERDCIPPPATSP